MKRWIANILCSFILLAPLSAQEKKAEKTKPPKQTSAQKKDAKLEEKAREVLKEDPDFIQVKVFVDDRIATLRGTVDLLSQRIRAEEKIRKIRGMQRVINEIALFPAALPDEVLRGRLQKRLESSDFEGLKFEVHQGRVIATGILPSRRQRQKAADIIQSTDGVKEYEDRISVADR